MKHKKIRRPNPLTEKAFQITFGVYKMGFMKSRQFDPTFCLEYIYNLLVQKATILNQDYNKVNLNDRELSLVYRMIRLDNQIKRKLK
jgi:hypothetical protein